MTVRLASNIAIAGFLLWALGVSTGMGLPYVYTAHGTALRVALFVALFLILFHFSYIYRGPDGKTGYEATIGRYAREKRIKITAGALVGLVFITAVVAWTSAAFPAWIATLFASRPYAKVFEIQDIQVRRGAVWTTRFELAVTEVSTQEAVSLLLPRKLYDPGRPWKLGERVCVKGRSSMFGTAIDSVSKDQGSC